MKSFIRNILFLMMFAPVAVPAAEGPGGNDGGTVVAQKKLVGKSYFDQGLATKQGSLPPIAGRPNQALTVKSDESDVEWAPLPGTVDTGASYLNGTVTAAAGWALDAQYTTLRKDIRSGLVTANIIVTKNTAALNMTSGANVKVAQLPAAFYLVHPGTTWILTPVAGYGAGREPNSLVMWMDTAGQVFFYNYSASAFNIAVGNRFGTNMVFPGPL